MINNMELTNGIEQCLYGTSKLHRILYTETNIGENAQNLTIIVLTYNREQATIKLIQSLIDVFPSYEGKIILFDNGSTKESLEMLEEFIRNVDIDIDLIKSKENLGVAKGRNNAIKYVKTEWAMFLDNDIYFTKNIFKAIRNSISQLGCKFLNLPLLNQDEKTLFSYGGNIFISDENNSMHVGCGSTYKQTEINLNSLNNLNLDTFLFGGCSVVNVNKFLECGAFDENMKIGFEDIDFSIRLFNFGYKIGCCNEIGLVHNHEQSEKKDDIEYEKVRFSSRTLLESALYFEKKHQLKVWNGATEQWLRERERELGINDESDSNCKKNNIINKAKVALIVDTRNWALDNIAQNIIHNLKYKYDFKIIYMDEIPDSNIALVFYACAGCDLIHFFWRGHLHYFFGDFVMNYLKNYNGGREAFVNNIVNNFIVTTGVYDHSYLENDINFTKEIFEFVDSYTVSSKKLFNIYKKLDLKKPFVEITDGVDLQKFYPINIERLKSIKDRELVVGWVGNSHWSGDAKKDHKGLNTIIKPAIEELVKEGYNIKLELTDKQQKQIPHNEMVKFYSKIDLYICASLNEGTPNPVLEAMACGIPIISTDVGIVLEVFGKEQKKYILEERTKECLKEKIKLFINNINEIELLSNENLKQIKDWSWERKTKEFEKFFDDIIQRKGKNNEIKNEM